MCIVRWQGIIFQYKKNLYTGFMSPITTVLIIQPPLVQLNTAYPAGAYLKAFFSQLKEKKPQWNLGEIQWIDGCNLLFHSIFCKKGLEHIFAMTEGKALLQAQQWEKAGRHSEVFNVRRYLSQKDGWIKWIDSIVAILQGQQRELCHEFIASPGVPRGQRMENFLLGLDRMATVDDAVILASLALADLADYIGTFFDSSFELIRYGEALVTSHRDFSVVEKGLEAPVLRDFYLPVINEILENHGVLAENERLLLCVSCPFPGTLAAALFTCKKFKEVLGNKVFVVIGGGYVNTELRQVKDVALSSYFDALSYDRGYGSYWDFFCHLEKLEDGCKNSGSGDFPLQIKKTALYKMRFFDADFVTLEKDETERKAVAQIEDEFTSLLAPDYSDIDFTKYPRLADSSNPMHRLWSDGAWLKAYLAHGCYWHQCAFCDTSLDYVCSYKKVAVQALYKKIYLQAKRAGVMGLHLVDEAAPPSSLRDLALENFKSQSPLVFWGNIRYERVFSRDLADFLSHGGLRAVSGGIEIASGSGLDIVQKGTDLQSIVAACAAFKEAGILTHAYMIYGYWLETPQMLIDSMETLRQLFAAGLLDSAFWHKFVLTRHSRIFQEWKEGLHPDLKPQGLDIGEETIFASNDLQFEGERKSAKYGEPLNAALSAWMRGEELTTPVERWFSFPMPRASVASNLVEQAIGEYEIQREKTYNDYKYFSQNWKKYCWIAGYPMVVTWKNGFQLSWTYMGELLYAALPKGTDKKTAEQVACWLYNLSPGKRDGPDSGLAQMFSNDTILSAVRFMYKKLRGNGLCRVF